MVKAGTFLYSDSIQKENIQRFQSWKSLILKTLESLFELMVLNVNAGFYLIWTELILVLSALLKQYFPSDSTEKVIKPNTSV